MIYLKILQNFNWTGWKQNFQLKQFDTTVTLKYGQSHWKRYEHVKLNKQQNRAKLDIYHVYNVWENCSL